METNDSSLNEKLTASEYFARISHEYGKAIEIMNITSNDEIIGREDKLHELSIVLNKRKSPVALLRALPGVGKTALVKAWKLYQDRQKNMDVQVISLSVIGLSKDGDMGDRMRRIIPDLAKYEKVLQEENPKARVLLFIDEAHTIVSAFDITGVSTKIGGELLKTVLTDCPIMVVGASTPQEISTYILTDEALARRFDIIDLRELDRKRTKSALRKELIKLGGEGYQYSVPDDVLIFIMTCNRRLRVNLAEPAKSLQILESAFSIHEVEGVPLDKKVVERVFAMKNITLQQRYEFKKIKDIFTERIKGQNTARVVIEAAIINVIMPTGDRKKALATILMMGPTGVGKTETVKAMAEALTGDSNNYGHIDMANYSGEKGRERLAMKVGTLVDADPDKILLFDEIEKVKENQDMFLEMLDEGHVTYFLTPRDTDKEIERVVSLSNTIIFATTNAGAEMFYTTEKHLGASSTQIREEILNKWAEEKDDLQESLMAEGFKVEMLNRFSYIAPYYALTKKAKVEIVQRVVQKLLDELRNDYEVEVDLPTPKDWGGNYKEYGIVNSVIMYLSIEMQQGDTAKSGGARNVHRVVRDMLADPIKLLVLESGVKRLRVKTNGKCGFEQNTLYRKKWEEAKQYGITDEQFEEEYSQYNDHKAGRLEIEPLYYAI